MTGLVGREGFEPPKHYAPGLQPGPFGHSGISPWSRRRNIIPVQEFQFRSHATDQLSSIRAMPTIYLAVEVIDRPED
jgi:hypothetical protein